MGQKGYCMILLLLLFPVAAFSQDFPATDSITYKLYLSGDWEELIITGNKALDSGIDYKFLRQRLGVAYFSLGKYHDAASQFSAALKFDSYDQFTLEYLYYTDLNNGKESYTGVLSNRMIPEVQRRLRITRFQALKSIETEFSYKISETRLRSNSQYYRLGISSKLSRRLELFQSFSYFNQMLIYQETEYENKFRLKQPEYYLSLGWNTSKSLILRSSYHLLNTNTDGTDFHGKLFRIDVLPNFNRFIFETNASYLNSGIYNQYQLGITGGYVFPVRSDLYLKASASLVLREGSTSFVYNTVAGLRLWKDAWLEQTTTFGKMEGYNDYNGLYVYNNYDPVVFRSGSNFIWYLGRKAALWVSFAWEKKQYFEDDSFLYHQFSYLGGIKWKI
jgi:hypothetical protein